MLPRFLRQGDPLHPFCERLFLPFFPWRSFGSVPAAIASLVTFGSFFLPNPLSSS